MILALLTLGVALAAPCGVASFPMVENAEQLGWFVEAEVNYGCTPDVLYIRTRMGDAMSSPGGPITFPLVEAALAHIDGMSEEDRPLLAVRISVTDGNKGESGRRAPPWMEAAGWVNKEGDYWAPDWSDKGFLESHGRLLESLKTTLEPHHEAVGWVEVGTYGLWGEWHMTPGNHPLASLEASETAQLAILAQYEQHLGKYPMVIAYDAIIGKLDDDELLECDSSISAVARTLSEMGVGLRNDAVYTQIAQFKEEVGEAAACVGGAPKDAFPGIWGAEFQGDNQARMVLKKNKRAQMVLEHLQEDALLFVAPGGFEPLIQHPAWRKKGLVPEFRIALPSSKMREAINSDEL